MTVSNNLIQCLNCERSDEVTPLVSLRYQGDQAWVCTQCLPILIHNPHQLVGKLAGAEKLSPADHNDH